MKISIITACFNNQETIEDTLLSVKSQTYKNLEHIIIDGGSTDNTLSIVKKFDHISKIVSEQDDGIYFALNKGIRESTGDVIGFLHSDDFFSDENVVEKIAETFENSSCDATYSDLDYVSFSNPQQIIRRWKSGFYNNKKLRSGWMPPHPTFYVKKEIFDKYKYFNTEYKISADYDLILRFLTNSVKLLYIPEVLIKMRVGGVSNNKIMNILIKSTEDYRIIKRNNVGGVFTLFKKNFFKISQFWKR